MDQFQNGIPGIPVRGVLDDGSGLIAHAVTSVSGNYTLGLMNDDSWSVSLLDAAAQGVGYVGDRPSPVQAASGQTAIDNLTVYPIDAWVTGTVSDSNNQPVANMSVDVTSASSGVIVEGKTVADGTYRLGVQGDVWEISLSAESLGYEPVSPVQTSVALGETSVVDFTVLLLPQQVNTLTITKSQYTVRKTTLVVDASSDYQDANLVLEFAGATVPMVFKKLFKGKYLWSYTSTNVPSAPATVTVFGSEGDVAATVVVK